MDALSLLFFVGFLVVAFWLAGKIANPTGKTIAWCLIVGFAVLWVLQGFHLLGGLTNLRIH